MRLIDADELKKSLNFVYACSYIGSKSKEGIASDIIDVIDNTPTVPLPDFKEGYKQAILDGKTNFSRPQGEWIDTGYMEEYWAEEYQCSICGAKDHWHNYCPNCGTKMEGNEPY